MDGVPSHDLVREEGKCEGDVRLILALGASDPCHRAEDDDEDDADQQAPTIAIQSVSRTREDTAEAVLPVRHVDL